MSRRSAQPADGICSVCMTLGRKVGERWEKWRKKREARPCNTNRTHHDVVVGSLWLAYDDVFELLEFAAGGGSVRGRSEEETGFECTVSHYQASISVIPSHPVPSHPIPSIRVECRLSSLVGVTVLSRWGRGHEGSFSQQATQQVRGTLPTPTRNSLCSRTSAAGLLCDGRRVMISLWE